jgi:hypothetical protein
LQTLPQKEKECKTAVAEFFCTYNIGLSIVESEEYKNLIEALIKMGQNLSKEMTTEFLPKLNRKNLKSYIDIMADFRAREDLLSLKRKHTCIIIDAFTTYFGHFVVVLLSLPQYSDGKVCLLGLYPDVWNTEEYAEMYTNILVMCYKLEIIPSFVICDGAYAQIDACNPDHPKGFLKYLPPYIKEVPGICPCANHRADAVFNHARKLSEELDRKCMYVHKCVVLIRKTPHGRGCPECTNIRWIYIIPPMEWIMKNKDVLEKQLGNEIGPLFDVVEHLQLLLEPVWMLSLVAERNKSQLCNAYSSI